MRIAIIGTGNVGSALGGNWARAGHDIVYGARDASSPKVSELAAATGARAASVGEAAEACDVVVLATSWDGTQDAIAACGDLSGKVVLDATNPLSADLMTLTVGTTSSGGERVAEWATGARVVKVFNTVGAGVMANPKFGSERATMLYCGDDPDAKAVAATLAGDAGFDPVDAGPLSYARYLEPFALLWIRIALDAKSWDFAFNLVKR